jgi:hypothetical protein
VRGKRVFRAMGCWKLDVRLESRPSASMNSGRLASCSPR